MVLVLAGLCKLLDGCSVLIILYCIMLTDAGLNNNPSPVSVHENYDSAKVIWSSIDATCTVSGTFGLLSYSCEECGIGNTNMFSISGMQISKKACSTPGCGPVSGTACSATNGCMNGGQSYTTTVSCRTTSKWLNGDTSGTLTLTATNNAAPTFTFNSGSSITVTHANSVNDVINTMNAIDSDSNIDSGTVYYRLNSGPGASYIHGNTLFGLTTTNGQITVLADLTNEFSNTYTMDLCVYDRRNDETCNELTITLDACFETPTCNDQSTSIDETFSLHTGHGTTNKLFDMTYPDPSGHFTSFSSSWHGLEWSIQSSNLGVASMGQYNGELTTTGNISVFPAHPSKVYTVVIEVSNPSESCYTTTCTMSITVAFKNWDPEIRSLPASINIHEDTDAEVLIHNVTVYDYNDPAQDNVTCSITNINPNENNLFELRNNDSLYAEDSFYLYKLRCQDAGCGYQGENYLCDTNIGCLNYDVNNQYVITIQCVDAYGASDTDTFTFNVNENQAPVWRNLPNSVTLDTDDVADLDTIFSILYTDAENERLFYNYVFSPNEGNFEGTSSGNYYNDLGNITATIQFWERTNSTFTITINGHERRNEIEETLTVHIREYCGPTPNCNSDSQSVTVEYTIGDTLFTVATLVVSPGQYTGLSYALSASSPSFFTINTGTGIVTTSKTLDASYPSTTYDMHAFVYDVNACGYGTCPLTVTVTPVNYDLSITSLPATYSSIHEDETASLQLHVIVTSDDNPDDTVDCEITTITPAQPAGSVELFYLTETIPGSDVFVINSRNNPGFTSATIQYTIDVSCQDSQGSSDTGTLTVNIELNIGPTFTNLANPTSVNVDPATSLSGALIYTVTATDTENDVLTYTCTVTNTFVPLTCTGNFITLRRDVDFEDEDGATYTIDMCVSDPKHTDSDCGQLSVLFTSSRTYPLFSNLPVSVTVAENAAVGNNLYTISVNDPDVGDTHTFTFHDAVPSSGFTQFALDNSNGEVTIRSSLDYESQSSYVLWYKVRDQYLLIHVAKTIIVTVTDVNEDPTLTQELYSLTIGEDKEVGYVLTDPSFNCTDPDAGDTQAYSITSGTHQAYFSIDDTTGILSLAQVYDLESGLPSSTSLGVTCTDGGGLTSSVDITVQIETVNEFDPVLTVTYPDASNIINIFSNTSILDDLLTVSATDADVNNAGSLSFSILGDGHGELYFIMTSLTSSSATLRISNYITLWYNTTFNFTIKVSDGDSPERYTGYAVNIYYYAPPPGLPTKEDTWCFPCSYREWIIVGVLAAELVIIIGISLHCFIHFCRARSRRMNHGIDHRKTRRDFLQHISDKDIQPSTPEVESPTPDDDDDDDDDDDLTSRERRQKHFDSILRPKFSQSRLSHATPTRGVSPSMVVASPNMAAPSLDMSTLTPDIMIPPNVPETTYEPSVDAVSSNHHRTRSIKSQSIYKPDISRRHDRDDVGLNYTQIRPHRNKRPAEFETKYKPDLIQRPQRSNDHLTHLNF